jgi:hypothetical protein
MQILTVNLDVFQRFIQQQLFNGLTAQLGDFTLQATNARFTRVVTNNADNGAVVDGQLAFLQRVTFDLLRQQVTFGDVQLFIFGVTERRITSIRSSSGAGMFMELEVATNITSLRS